MAACKHLLFEDMDAQVFLFLDPDRLMLASRRKVDPRLRVIQKQIPRCHRAWQGNCMAVSVECSPVHSVEISNIFKKSGTLTYVW